MDKKKLAVIHIVKKELALSDEEYRNILQREAGVNSAKELDGQKFRRLMNFFVRSSYYRLNPFGLTIKQKLYMKYLAKEIGWDAGHLKNFIHKYYHRPDIDSLTREEAIKAIESLKAVRLHRK
jgi:hypothetical protein